MNPIKVFRVVEIDGHGMGNEVKHHATYLTKEKARAAIQRTGSAYLEVRECWAIKVGLKTYLLASENPITVTE